MLTKPQDKVLDYLNSVGGVDIPTYEVGIRIYGIFFGSYKSQLKAAQKVLQELHRLNMVVKNYSHTHYCDVWSIKKDEN